MLHNYLQWAMCLQLQPGPEPSVITTLAHSTAASVAFHRSITGHCTLFIPAMILNSGAITGKKVVPNKCKQWNIFISKSNESSRGGERKERRLDVAADKISSVSVSLSSDYCAPWPSSGCAAQLFCWGSHLCNQVASSCWILNWP